MNRIFAMIVALALCLTGWALAEEAKVTNVNSLLEEGSFIVQIDVSDGDEGWVADDMAQDDSIVKLYDADIIENTFVARYDAVSDGDVTVGVRHMENGACDRYLTWDLRVKDGAVAEVTGGSSASSPDEMSQDPLLSGEWLVNDEVMAGLTIEKNEGKGWAMQIAMAYPKTQVLRANLFFDCEQDQFVYNDGIFYQSEITNSPEIVIGDEISKDAIGVIKFVTAENGETKLGWYDAATGLEATFRRLEDNDGEPMAEGADSDWYMDVLIDADLMAKYPHYAFVDVNDNGVPALFITTTADAFLTEADHGLLFIYSKGDAKQVMEFGGAGGDKFYCNAETHTLTHYSRLSGEQHIEVFRVEDGELKPVTAVDAYTPNHGPAGRDAALCLQDGQEITEEAGDALFEQYANEDEVVTYGETYQG